MRPTTRQLLVAALATITATTTAQIKTISLNSGDGEAAWTIFPEDDTPDSGNSISTVDYTTEQGVEGIVPGTVFASYVAAGEEPCPEYADNIYKVDETLYNRPFWYRTEFNLSAADIEGRRVWLCFDNTNRFADFYFNGKKISGTPESRKDVSGHMLRSRFDVTTLADTERGNALAVLIYDPDQKKTRDDTGPYGVACSPTYLAAAGWDWMPYVPGRLAGITGNARVEITGDVVLSDPWMRSRLLPSGAAELTLTAEVRNLADSPRDVTLTGTVQPGDISFVKTVHVESNASAVVIIDKHDAPAMTVDKPQLWWPNGYGDPNIYSCRLECSANGEVSDSRNITFGIREYDYRIESNNAGKPVLTLYVNGCRVFCRGGNWGMSEYMLRCRDEEYDKKVRLHKDMNYNMIRLWTGCVTDDAFYDCCDRYGIMVWDDFWLYVAYNDVEQPESFKTNARDKVRRLRNHPSIAVWCGANETHPSADLDAALRLIVIEEDGNDRLYKSCSNQDAMSGSGWWKDLPPRHHFSTSGSNLAFNTPPYPYGSDHGYGFRSEIGMATFPTFESVRLFIPEEQWWPLPDDEQLRDSDTVWNSHFFGKEASNACPADYKNEVDRRFGESKSLEEFCEKAQLLNLEDMKGMYEAWNDKMWNDATALLLWMSNPAYPSFVWQTYDYYYDPTGAYWGAKSACEPQHIQWNCLTNSVKVVNSTREKLTKAAAEVRIYDMSGNEIETLRQCSIVDVPETDIAEAFTIDFTKATDMPATHFIRLRLTSAEGNLLSENFYWRNGENELDYRALNDMEEAKVTAEVTETGKDDAARCTLTLHNESAVVALACRVRLVNRRTGERVLPVLMSENYVTLMPGETREINVEAAKEMLDGDADVLVKQFGKKERRVAMIKN